jgi:hypothetical protein
MDNTLNFIEKFLGEDTIEKLINKEATIFDLFDITLKDDDNNLIISLKKKDNKEINIIQEELDNMDDDLFTESAQLFKNDFPEDFEILQNMQEEPIEKVKESYSKFKLAYKHIVNNHYSEALNVVKKYKDILNTL